ncbi:Microsomal glutathione S-transferase 1 [Holothuria leucospilota]|uniref:Microsomal glutathione S-transferase 1 n=1 Tax=Holothuria leucospilota TaxID=206669 RepID=A0A9Q1C6D0_HOLLE|nr:Microsomal glutathione S-transferase 1 [Holothuria leucospilota]
MADDAKSLFVLENDVFKVYLTYAVLVVFKMMFLSFYTATIRISSKLILQSFANKEDFGPGYPEDKAAEKIAKGNPKIDRIRRCHLNDLENIPAFLIVGLLYVAINPSLYTATMHYRIFAAARYFHCVAYLLPLPQPSRALAFGTGATVTISMGVQILRAAAQF